MKTACRHIGWGALIGLGIGVLLAAYLLYCGLQGSIQDESWEGAATAAYLVSWPTRELFVWLDWGLDADHWPLFVAVAPALNGLVLGALAGVFTFLLSELFRWSHVSRAL
jgi:hypothetical protein